MNIDKILIYNKDSYSKKVYKYFIGYKDDQCKIKPLYIMLPKLSRYGKCFDKTKHLSILIKDDELLKKYNKIWDKVSIVSNSIKKGFDSEP